jgi:hypothetical protein
MEDGPMDWRDCTEDEADKRDTLTPILASIPAARRYMGGVSRSLFYRDLLPKLQTVNFGTRRFVVVRSMDRLIAERATVQVSDAPAAAASYEEAQTLGPLPARARETAS